MSPDPGADLPSDLPSDLGGAVRAAAGVLTEAGVASPRVDAELLAAHLMGLDRGGVALAALRGDPAPDGLAALVARRAARVPLQHLTGTAPFRGLVLAVGPGVFVPRPETETTAGIAIDAALAVGAARAARPPVVVDLCAGSGAIAAAVAAEVPGARVHAVELEREAWTWARRNLAGTGVNLHLADAADALPGLDGGVDVVVSNPPYVPPGAVPREVEVAEHDPPAALWGGGPDGLDVPRAVVASAARLLSAGGTVVVEHAEVQQDALLGLLGGAGWSGARGHLDLAGRPRCVSAVKV